jgi:hypothetical protein
MKFNSAKRLICLSLFVCGFEFAVVSHAQSPPAAPLKPSEATPGRAKPQSDSSYPSADIDVQRKQIWESDEMLEARAWLEDRFQKSARISDAQGKKYLADVKAMSPDQMKLWLIKFQQDRNQRITEGENWRRLNQKRVQAQMASPQVGGFRNPYGGQGRASSGLPAAGMRQSIGGQSIGGQSNPFAQRPTVQKPFSSPHYQQSVRPLVTSEEAARFEVLRGLGSWRY